MTIRNHVGFVKPFLALLTSNKIVYAKIIFPSKESWAHPLPQWLTLSLVQYTLIVLGDGCCCLYLICCSSIMIVFFCHCLVHVKKLVGFCVQVRVVMCTFIMQYFYVAPFGASIGCGTSVRMSQNSLHWGWGERGHKCEHCIYCIN